MIETRALPSDTDLLALHRLDPLRYPVLLESVASGTAQGRWDFLLVAGGKGLRLDADGVTRDLQGNAETGDFLAALDRHWQAERTPREEPRWPFRGGWALLLAYELAHQVEPVLQLPRGVAAHPVALALRCPAAVLRDRSTGDCVIVAEAGQGDLIARTVADVAVATRQPDLPMWQPPSRIDEDAPERFTEGVQRILDYLRAGDIFQVNLSRAWHARFEAELEQVPRGAYTGAFGWLNRDGDLDLNILIRSAEILAEGTGSVARFRTGAGIVADSVPEKELDETRAKARGVLKALEG